MTFLTIARAAGFFGVLAIIVLSLVPGAYRPHTGLPGVAEHFIAYYSTGFLSFTPLLQSNSTPPFSSAASEIDFAALSHRSSVRHVRRDGAGVTDLRQERFT
jgi:hypothetical protein